MPTKAHKLPLMPWRGSLMTAGSQSSMAENMLWEAENVSVRLDGTLMKRPGIRQWGQTLMEPDPNATGTTVRALVPFIDTTAPLAAIDNSTGLITTSVVSGELRTAVGVGGNGLPPAITDENYSLVYPGGALPAGAKWGIRFVFRGLTLPAYSAAGTVPNTFAFRVQASATSAKEFAIWAGGIYYKRASDDQYVLITGTEDVGGGVISTIEVQCDDAASTLVYINDVLVATITSSLLKDATLNGANSLFEFRWQVEGSNTPGTNYSTVLMTPMYSDTNATPFIGQEVTALDYFPYRTSSGARIRSLVAAAGGYIYHDNNQMGVWRPLKSKQNRNIFFATFNRTLIWCDHNGGGLSSMWQWTGEAAPTILDDAPPVTFAAEHKTRIFAAGDARFPLRLYYTGSRQANLWFSPSEDNAETEVDALFQAGYIPVPARRGDAITAIWGDYFDSLIVATRTGIWQLSGSGPDSWKMDAISQSHGIEAPLLITQVGDDIWYGSRYGIHSLLTTDKYGRLSTEKPSTPIGNMWSQQTSGGRKVARDYLHTGKIVYSPQQQMTLVALPLSGDQNSDHIMAHSQVTQGWYGPWTIESRALAIAEITTPLLEVVLHGTSDGKVGYTYMSKKADYGTGVVDVRIATAALSGRSIEPTLHGQIKTWKTLNLYVQPRGEWNITVQWYGDNKLAQDPITVPQLREPDPIYVLSDDFRLDESPDGVLRSEEEIRIIKIPIDERSAYLYLFIEESAAGEDIVLQGAEIEFTVSQVEE